MAGRPRNEATVHLTRRGLSAAVLGLGLAGPAMAVQEPPSEIELIPNLFTRVGALVRVNGHGPFVFVIDTGAGRTVIADTVAAQIGLPAAPSVILHDITTATLTQTVNIDRLMLVGETFRDIQAPVLPRHQLGADGLIGLDVLGAFRLGFDIPRRKATLDRGQFRIVQSAGSAIDGIGSRIRRNVSQASLGRFGQLILTTTEANGIETSVFIDSGAQYSIGNLALYKSVAAKRADLAIQQASTSIFGVTGQPLLALRGELQNLRLGRSRLDQTSIFFADLHCFETLGLHEQPAVLVGADVLSRFRGVQIDFPARQIHFDGLIRTRNRQIHG